MYNLDMNIVSTIIEKPFWAMLIYASVKIKTEKKVIKNSGSKKNNS